ncbi:MAG: hypothetical protein WBV37_10700 [Nocardioidaceae bacterium]
MATEYSFAFDVASPADLHERLGHSGVTSLSVGTLQLEVAIESRLLLFAWGLHPREAWSCRAIGRPEATSGAVRVEGDIPLKRGVTVPLAAVGEWTTEFDEGTGWLRIAEDPDRRNDDLALLATGVVVGLSDGRLTSLWLAPSFE